MNKAGKFFGWIKLKAVKIDFFKERVEDKVGGVIRKSVASDKVEEAKLKGVKVALSEGLTLVGLGTALTPEQSEVLAHIIVGIEEKIALAVATQIEKD